MPAFKPKANKKIKHDEKSTVTLDHKHKEMLDKFKKDKDVIIPELKEKRVLLKQRLKTAKTTDEKLELQDEIAKIKTDIKNLVKQEKEYLLNNSKISYPSVLSGEAVIPNRNFGVK